METLTEERIAQISADIVARTLKDLKEPQRKFMPGQTGDMPAPEGERREWKRFGEFLKAVADFHAGRLQPGDWRMKALSEGTDTAGGFLVPEQYLSGIETRSLEDAIVRPLARRVPMTSDTLNYPLVRDRSHSSNLFGGVIAYWTEEAGTKTAADPVFDRIKLIAKKLTGFTFGSDELLEDSAVALESLLIDLFGSALNWYEEEAFWQGNGVGQPLGIFNGGAVIAPFRAVANQVALADLGALMARFQGNLYAPSVTFVANKGVLPYLIQLGSTYITWATIAGQRIPGSLFGIPLQFSEHVPALGSQGDIGLYDLNQYVIGDRKGLTINRSIEYRFATDETTWRFVKRVDGQPLVDAAFTPKRGSTLSPFVQLASTTQ